MSFLKALQKASTEVEYPPGSGLFYRLKSLVGGHFLQEHVALLAAVLPPNSGDMLTMQAIDGAEGPEKAELQKLWANELAQKAADPDLQARAWEHSCACVIAAVIAGHGPDEDWEWEPLKIVAAPEDRDPEAKPCRLALEDLPPGTIQFLSSIIRQTSFGGEAARQRIARFRREQGSVSRVGEVG